jgi:hypothetical protein
VQPESDQRQGASETGTVPTARVRHKEQLGFGRRRSILLLVVGSISDLPVADPAAWPLEAAIGGKLHGRARGSRALA